MLPIVVTNIIHILQSWITILFHHSTTICCILYNWFEIYYKIIIAFIFLLSLYLYTYQTIKFVFLALLVFGSLYTFEHWDTLEPHIIYWYNQQIQQQQHATSKPHTTL
jgi:hypothetical protein